jgi:hypothetical protein
MLSEEGEKNWKLRNFNLPNVFFGSSLRLILSQRFVWKKF